MKSAYEIAMEKMERSSGPAKKLSDAQKQRVAEIEKVCEAKIASVKLDYEPKIAATMDAQEFDDLKAGMAREIMALTEKRDTETDAVWEEA